VIDAGQLRERITIQQATESRNRLGETTYTYDTFAEGWASVTGVTARFRLPVGPTGVMARSVRVTGTIAFFMAAPITDAACLGGKNWRSFLLNS